MFFIPIDRVTTYSLSLLFSLFFVALSCSSGRGTCPPLAHLSFLYIMVESMRRQALPVFSEDYSNVVVPTPSSVILGYSQHVAERILAWQQLGYYMVLDCVAMTLPYCYATEDELSNTDTISSSFLGSTPCTSTIYSP